MKKGLPVMLLCVALLVGAALFLPLLTPAAPELSLADLPPYCGQPSVVLEGNLPDFPNEDKHSTAFEQYSPLDDLGRCGPAYANLGVELMPTAEREPIGMVKPSGWRISKYDFIDGSYLYNRCHLIGYQFTGQNANEENLITGTRYMNVQGMLPYENQVAHYLRSTGNHVLYRVTPRFTGTNPLCDGVEMEAWSVEDGGKGVCFHVFAYNVQPGVVIDYTDGDNRLVEGAPVADRVLDGPPDYIINVKTYRFHRPDCPGVEDVRRENRREYWGDREVLVGMGFVPCGTCGG